MKIEGEMKLKTKLPRKDVAPRRDRGAEREPECVAHGHDVRHTLMRGPAVPDGRQGGGGAAGVENDNG